MAKHTGPYTITIKSARTARVFTFTRKTFKAAENIAAGMFDRTTMEYIRITNAKGCVHSIYQKGTQTDNGAAVRQSQGELCAARIDFLNSEIAKGR